MQLPTIRQVYTQMKQSYNDMKQTLVDIGVCDLPEAEDLQNKKITINKVLKEIPTEQRLDHILKHASSKDQIKDRVLGYVGDNQLIKTAKSNFGQIKKQQQIMYYLAAKCQLPSVSPQFKDKGSNNLDKLYSYTSVAMMPKSKLKVLQKNSISQEYLQEGQAQLDTKNEPVVISSRKSQELKKMDLLVHVNFYDSHNTEKQYQFVCLQDQILSSLVQKFKCLIDSLQNLDKIKMKSESGAESAEIYDKFYQSKSGKVEATNSQNAHSLKYLIIQDSIYYQGNRTHLEPLLNAALNKNKQYRCLQLNKTRINDLRVVFGRPYIYRHLQGCDHVVIFKQARLFMGNDQFNHDIIQVDKYPITVFQSKMKRKKCQGCSQCFSQIVSIADPLKNGDNLFLCLGCHQNLHLDGNGGSKMGDKIKFIPYIHD